MLKASEALKAVLALFTAEPDRWVKYRYAVSEPRTRPFLGFFNRKKQVQCYCLAGALAKVHGHEKADKVHTLPGYRELAEAIFQARGIDPALLPLSSHRLQGEVESWNDASDRTIKDVMGVTFSAIYRAYGKSAIAAVKA